MNYQQILDFWFKETDKTFWFKKDTSFDELIRKRFDTVYAAAIKGELFNWRINAQGRLAEIIVLDQFSRNLFRDSAKAFSSDPLSLCLAQEAVAQKLDLQLSLSERAFLYMPYMHSESLLIHEQAVELFSVAGLEDNLRFEMMHKQIIERFNRYPHRNQLLARQSTEEEIEFLKQAGSSF